MDLEIFYLSRLSFDERENDGSMMGTTDRLIY